MNETENKTLKDARRLFDMRKPIVKEFLINGPIRPKKTVLADCKHWIRMDERMYKQDVKHDPEMSESVARRLKKEHQGYQRIADLPSEYIVVLSHDYRAVTEADLQKAKVALEYVQKERDQGLRDAVKADLSKREIKVLSKALSLTKAPKGKKTVYRLLKRRLGLNRK